MKTFSLFCAVLTLGALSNAGMAQDKPKAEIPAAGADGWISLFNGKDLTGWEGLKGYWTVVDGAIQCSETKETSKQTDLILLSSKESPEKFANFEIRYRFKWLTPDGNSGLQIRGKIDNSPKACRDGVIGFQMHAGHTMTLQFKDIKIKMLDKK